jgi:glycosyltransferase involved in cell wall biosynthesis
MADHSPRVVIINDSSLARGGASKLALQLAIGLAKRNFDVTFFAGDDGYNTEFAEHGIDVRAISGETLLESPVGSILGGLYNCKARMALSELIEIVDRPDTVYHVHAWAQILSPSIFEALSPVAGRTALTAHDFFIACPNGNFSIYPKSRQCELTPLSAACVTADCDKRNYAHKLWRVGRQMVLNTKTNLKEDPYTVLAIQAGMTPYLVRGGVPEKRIRVMRNPAASLRHTRVNAEANQTILYVGRIEHEKGADLLAAAARTAGARLRIIGEGGGLAAAKLANPEAEFTGWLQQDEIAASFATARFLVMPTRCTEPFGLAAAEALRAGLPVMLSNSCLIGGDVERAGMGERVDIFDNSAFVAKISEWMRDDAMILTMSEAAFDNAGSIAQSDDEWLDAHITLYRELAGMEKQGTGTFRATEYGQGALAHAGHR